MQAHRLFTGFLLTLGTFGAVVPLGACSSSDSYVIVTVAARPAVHDAKSLTVGLTNAGTTRMDSLVLRDQAFPVTFSISTPGRTGDLAIAVDATDENGLVVGHGTATTTVAVPDASVELESTDFVVNTDYANDQFPADDFEASGVQLASQPDGTWTAVFRDSCMAGSCNIFARRFDPLGKPVQTAVSASSNAFNLTTTLTTVSSTPAVASSAMATIAVWDFYDVVGAATGVACRALDPAGRATANQATVATDAADVVSVAAMSNGNFITSWNATVTNAVIRSAVIKPDCTVVGAVQTISMAATTDFPHRSAVASSADHVLFAWIVDGNLHTRLASNLGLLTTNDTVLVPKTATEEIFHVRIAGVAGGGFVIAARWAQSSLVSGPGRIELFRLNAAGALVGAPTLITDKTDTDFDNREAFSIAGRPDGTLLVAWHTCGTLGDDHMCGVFGRIVRDTGDPVTDVFVIPTTTEGDQKLPSVVGLPDAFVAMWTDGSAKPPDIAGSSVRARLVYLPGVPGLPGK
jgi:hypothetical protein